MYGAGMLGTEVGVTEGDLISAWRGNPLGTRWPKATEAIGAGEESERLIVALNCRRKGSLKRPVKVGNSQGAAVENGA